MIRCVLSLLGVLLVAGCSTESVQKELIIERLDSPVMGQAGQVSVAALPGGGHLLSWIESTDGPRLMIATRKNGEWSDRIEVARGGEWFVNWADFPSVLAVNDSTWYTHILSRAGQGTYAYHVYALATTDAGETWSAPERLHDDASATEHGFVAMTARGRRALAIWLDGRYGAMSTQSDGHGHAPMSLRAGFISPDGTTQDSFEIDDSVCDCCQTAAINVGSSTVVAYRNRTADETRDIHIARFDGEEWLDLGSIHDDGWVIAGCPVNGPALASDGGQVGVAWFTAAADVPRVYAARSRDEGDTFETPIRLDEGRPLGRVDIGMAGENMLVSWIEETERGAELRLAQVGPGNEVKRHVVASISRSRGSGFPRLAISEREVLLAWLNYDEDLRSTSIELASIRIH